MQTEEGHRQCYCVKLAELACANRCMGRFTDSHLCLVLAMATMAMHMQPEMPEARRQPEEDVEVVSLSAMHDEQHLDSSSMWQTPHISCMCSCQRGWCLWSQRQGYCSGG